MFLDSYVDVASKLTDAPEIFHYYIGHGLISTLLGNRVFLHEGVDYLRPNLYIAIVAPSSAYRKSTCLNIASKLLHEIDRDLIYPDEFSQEKILEIMSEHPVGMMFHYEMASLMGQLKKDYMSGCKSFLTSMYDSPKEYSRKIKTKDFLIKEPSLNMIAATTSQWLVGNMSELDILGGFLPRWIIVPSANKIRNDPFRQAQDHNSWFHMKGELEALRELKGPMHLTKKAKSDYEEWYRDFWKKYCAEGLFSPFYVRYQVNALKFAMNHSASRMKMEIDEASIGEACERIDWLAKNLKVFENEEMVFGKINQMKKKVEKIIKAAGDAGVSRSVVIRRSHLSKFELDGVIDTLVAEDAILKTAYGHSQWYLWTPDGTDAEYELERALMKERLGLNVKSTSNESFKMIK